MRATKATIYLNNLCYNINLIKKTLQTNCNICVPVKADAYGHGAIQIAKECEKLGIEFLAVATVSEGIELRQSNIKSKILCFSLPQIEEIQEIVTYNITPFVFDIEFINELNKEAQKQNKLFPVHLKIDTGMGRVGCKYFEVSKIAECIKMSKNLYLEGTCTHFAVADSLLEKDIDYTKKQIKEFNLALEEINKVGMNPGIRHCASSGAFFLHHAAHFDMVRPGIAIYGYLPNPQIEKTLIESKVDCSLKPVMKLTTHIVAIKKVLKGDKISYGGEWTATEECFIGVLPIGYADGLLRRFSPNLSVEINQKLYPIVGRICMDQCMVLLGKDSIIKRGQEVILFGPKPCLQNADSLAKIAQTISYEILCCINKRVPRIYINEE